MALASTTAENQALDALGGSLPGSPVNMLAYTSLHTATTSTTGAAETTGGGYGRQATTWNNAGSGSKTNSSALTFAVAAATTLTHAGTWSASTSGTFGIGLPLGSSVTSTAVTVAAGGLTLSAT